MVFVKHLAPVYQGHQDSEKSDQRTGVDLPTQAGDAVDRQTNRVASRNHTFERIPDHCKLALHQNNRLTENYGGVASCIHIFEQLPGRCELASAEKASQPIGVDYPIRSRTRCAVCVEQWFLIPFAARRSCA